MDREQVWGARVAAWKKSGLNMNRFAQQHGFSPSSLRYWVRRLGSTASSVPHVRLARVVRRADEAGSGEAARCPLFTLEISNARIHVAPGFDRDSLSSILEILDRRASGARR